jgi:hypothetical protein
LTGSPQKYKLTPEEHPMENVAISGIVLAALALKGLAFFAIVYAGTRLAIRHERRAAQ